MFKISAIDWESMPNRRRLGLSVRYRVTGSEVGTNAAHRLHFVATGNPRAAGVRFVDDIYLNFLETCRRRSLKYIGLKVHKV